MLWRIMMEVVYETYGIEKFKEFMNHVWIQATRDPKKVWLDMQYCVARGEVDWIIKDWPVHSGNSLVEKPTMRIKMIQSSRRKDKTKVGLSTTTSSLPENTRKARIETQLSGNNTIPK
jgi:hypothetical protein